MGIIIIITCDNTLLKLINLLITYFATCKEEDAKTTRQLYNDGITTYWIVPTYNLYRFNFIIF